MVVEIIPELVLSGTGFFFYVGIDIIMPGAGVNSNTFLFKDVLVK